jgi:hypothetical protein
MRLDTNGNVGIGTTTPLSKLSVNGGLAVGTYAGANAAPANGMIVSDSVGIGTTSPVAMSSGDSTLHVVGGIRLEQRDTNSNPLFIGSNGTATVFVSVNSLGKVGLGLAAANHQLELSTDDAAKLTTTTWTTTSDERLKKNVVPFTDGLSVLAKVDPVSFQFNGLGGTPDNYPGISILAQAIQKVAPYTVSTYSRKLHPTDTTETELYNFNYSALGFVTINAIKELNQRTTSLYPGTNFQIGDVVSFDKTASSSIHLSNPNEDVAGVVSSLDILTNQPRVSYSGTSLVKVSLENGPILTGDRLTTSNTSGIATKATKAGSVIGIALEPISTISSGSYQKINVFVNSQYYAGDITGTGNLANLSSTSYDINGLLKTSSGLFDINILFASIIDRFNQTLGVVFKNGFLKIAEIVTRKVTTDKLCVGATCVNEDQLKQLLQNAGNSLPTPTPDATPLVTASPSPTASASATPLPTSSPTPTPSPSATPVETPVETPTPSATPAPSDTPIPTTTP